MHRALSRAHIIINCELILSVKERRKQYRTLQIIRGGNVLWCAEFNCNLLENFMVSRQFCIAKLVS